MALPTRAAHLWDELQAVAQVLREAEEICQAPADCKPSEMDGSPGFPKSSARS